MLFNELKKQSRSSQVTSTAEAAKAAAAAKKNKGDEEHEPNIDLLMDELTKDIHHVYEECKLPEADLKAK